MRRPIVRLNRVVNKYTLAPGLGGLVTRQLVRKHTYLLMPNCLGPSYPVHSCVVLSYAKFFLLVHSCPLPSCPVTSYLVSAKLSLAKLSLAKLSLPSCPCQAALCQVVVKKLPCASCQGAVLFASLELKAAVAAAAPTF